MFSKYFGFIENDTCMRTEILAGITTFLTMAYILFVQPDVLSKDFAGNPTGLSQGSILFATCIVSAVACIAMGLYARLPIALAPGMGENYFFISVIMGLAAAGVTDAWKTALAVVFVSGVIFFLVSVFKLREMILEAISPSMRSAIACGIGLFIAFIGLEKANVITAAPGTLVQLNISGMTGADAVDIWIFFTGLFLIGALIARKVKGAILIGILSGAAIALACGKISLPKEMFGFPDISKSAVMAMDFRSIISSPKILNMCLLYITTFLFMDVFDTIGTLVGVTEQAGLVKDNKIPNVTQALLVDSGATAAGACFGTSTVTSYIESAAGVEAGGRTGMTAVVTGLMFILALFLSPLIISLATYGAITAPAIVIVGAMMMKNVLHIDWNDAAEFVPAFLVVVGIPFTYSIANGLAVGFIAYPAIKLLSFRAKELKPLTGLLGLVLLAYFIYISMGSGK